MGKIKDILNIISPKREETGTANPETKKESAVVCALKRQIRLQDEIIVSYEETIRGQYKIISTHKEGNMQERLIDLAGSIFMPQPQPANSVAMDQTQSTLQTHLNPENERHLETGTNYKDKELKEILGYLSPAQLLDVSKMPKDQQINLIKQKMPQISNSSADRMIELAMGLI